MILKFQRDVKQNDKTDLFQWHDWFAWYPVWWIEDMSNNSMLRWYERDLYVAWFSKIRRKLVTTDNGKRNFLYLA